MAVFEKKVMAERVCYANLNTGSIWWEKKHQISQSARPFKDPNMAAIMEREYHQYLGADWTHGGWQENRSNIRRGTYIEKAKIPIHTGIDVNRGSGSEVRSLAHGVVVYVGDDSPMVGGWGNHLIQLISFRGQVHALLYAHLAADIRPPVGANIKKGSVVATIGDMNENGYWRPHLHLQLFAGVSHDLDWDKFSKEMDGYVKESEAALWARKCPDPTPLIFT